MNQSHLYSVDLQWEGGRTGTLSSDELDQSLPVATPPPFPKGVERIWSPEHLLTASVSSCIMTTFLAIAENSKLEFEDYSCRAKGKLELVEGKYVMTEILVELDVMLLKEEDVTKAERVIEKSEAVCLISNSIKSKVILEYSVRVMKTA